MVWDMPYWHPIPGATCAQASDPRYTPAAHAKGVNVVYADTHAKFSNFGRNETRQTCLEDWWRDHSWEGYHE